MPTSRCVMMQFLCGCTNSTGSSMVMMWSQAASLRWSTIEASVVLLPEPVAPTRMTSPRLTIVMSFRMLGSPSLSMLGRSFGMVRSTMPTCPCWTNALTRKRPMPCGEIAKLHSLVRSNSADCLSFMTERASAIVCWLDSGCGETLTTLPSTLTAGGKSQVRNRSDPPRETSRRSRSLMNLEAWSRSMVEFVGGWNGVSRGSSRANGPWHALRQAGSGRAAAGRRGSGRASACPGPGRSG